MIPWMDKLQFLPNKYKYDVLSHQPFNFIQNKQRQKENDECMI
jgi:hypothetical protein